MESTRPRTEGGAVAFDKSEVQREQSKSVVLLGQGCGLHLQELCYVLFRESRLPRDAVRVLMVLVCWPVAAAGRTVGVCRRYCWNAAAAQLCCPIAGPGWPQAWPPVDPAGWRCCAGGGVSYCGW